MYSQASSNLLRLFVLWLAIYIFWPENTAGEAPTVNFLLNKKNSDNSMQEETKREECLRWAAELN